MLSISKSLCSSKPFLPNPICPKIKCLPSPPPPTISTKDATLPELPLPAGLRRDLLPNHVAVIMDGNRRWARTRGLPPVSGYQAGIRALRLLVELCCKYGITVLTVFAFSSDNWFRPKVYYLSFIIFLFFKKNKKILLD